jgi:CxxC motif-containing protein (DUF1111 family)
MTKAHLGDKLSTSIAALMLSVVAAQNALAQSRNQGHGDGHDNGNSQSSGAVDPGVRGGTPGAGGPPLSQNELSFWFAAQAVFEEVDALPQGLGPRFNLDGCAGCHAQPAAGGSSPATNPQAVVATLDGAQNVVPSFAGKSTITGVSNLTFQPLSDFALHNMGIGLADGVSQGNANGFQFRSAPLWGIGQRIFFLHDGRTSDLKVAIRQHSSPGSEANEVIKNFNILSTSDQKALLNDLRSL